MNDKQNEKVSNLLKNSVTLKLVTISVLMLLLLIPTSMIKSIITEREQINNETTEEVSSKWAENQLINGPILTIPVLYEYEKNNKIKTVIRYWHQLPENLTINGQVEPKKLKRSIYEVVVYESKLSISGDFFVNPKLETPNLKEIQFHKAFLTIGISDLRGIKNSINLNWNQNGLKVKPGSKLTDLIYSGVTIDIPNLEEQTGKTIAFDFSLDIQGSRNLSFIPIGSKTEINLNSSWKSPSFNGNFLPDSRELDNNGFKASWSILQLNRNFPQTWIGDSNSKKMQDSAFGVDLILPLDDYQKSFRSAKYAIMTISLTFLVFFLTEILNKRKVHPFQYALIGLALCLFYILLVSLSEHVNFNLAYGLSTIGVVVMIALYSFSIFKTGKLTSLLVSTLLGIYGFLFVTLQLADYALLLGSFGLLVILGATMYFTRNINWYRLNIETE